jgi:hypothetical protein
MSGGNDCEQEKVAWPKQYLKFQQAVGMSAANAIERFFGKRDRTGPRKPRSVATTADKK